MLLGSSSGGRPTSAMREFPADYISHAGRKVGQCVDFFEDPTSSDRVGRDKHVQRMWRLREEHSVEPEIGKFRGGGSVLACEEVGLDRAGGKVSGPS
jgi:hypothetical protein